MSIYVYIYNIVKEYKYSLNMSLSINNESLILGLSQVSASMTAKINVH